MKKLTIALAILLAFSTGTRAQTKSMTVQVAGSASPSFGALSNFTVGKNLRISAWVPVYTSSPVTVTVTSSDAGKALVASTQTGAGASSATFSSVTTGFFLYVDGKDLSGTATLTASATGFTNATSTVTLVPSGFMICFTPVTAMNSFVGETDLTVQVCPTALTSAYKFWGIEALQPGAGPVTVTVTSSSPAAGTVTSPLTFVDGDLSESSTFHAVASGATTISLSTPAGYSTPNQ